MQLTWTPTGHQEVAIHVRSSAKSRNINTSVTQPIGAQIFSLIPCRIFPTVTIYYLLAWRALPAKPGHELRNISWTKKGWKSPRAFLETFSWDKEIAMWSAIETDKLIAIETEISIAFATSFWVSPKRLRNAFNIFPKTVQKHSKNKDNIFLHKEGMYISLLC